MTRYEPIFATRGALNEWDVQSEEGEIRINLPALSGIVLKKVTN
jgi:hypothetical protein